MTPEIKNTSWLVSQSNTQLIKETHGGMMQKYGHCACEKGVCLVDYYEKSAVCLEVRTIPAEFSLLLRVYHAGRCYMRTNAKDGICRIPANHWSIAP